MLATLQQQLQQKYTWVKSLRPHPEDTAALTPAEAEPNATADEAAGETSDHKAPGHTEARRLRLQVVVSDYRTQRNAMLLDELGHWAQEHNLALAPHIITEREQQQLELLGATDAPTPYMLHQHYRKQTAYPDNARQQAERALSEFQRILRDLEQEFPTSGLHAWSVGLHLQSVYQHIVSWGLAIFDLESTGTPEDWQTFLEKYRSYHPGLNQEIHQQYPLQLEAFLDRHQQLASLIPKSYGDNDLELEQLLIPLEHAVKAMRACVRQRLTRPEDAERRVALAWWAIMSLAVLGSCGLLAYYFLMQPSYFQAVKLPPNARPGAIVGNYYKGMNYEKWIGKRNDQRLDVRWPASPRSGVPSDQFSVEWKGYLYTSQSGTHKLCSRHDDGARFFIHNKKLIDDWISGWARTRCKKINLQRGWHPIKVNLFEKRKVAELHIKLQKPSDKRPQSIPPKHYCCRN